MARYTRDTVWEVNQRALMNVGPMDNEPDQTFADHLRAEGLLEDDPWKGVDISRSLTWTLFS